MAADNYRFAEGDSLLCYHGPMLYEAKCLKRRKANDGKAQYFIHYKGWNSKWEEWVDDNRVLSVNAANMNKMASLKEIHSNTKKSGGKRSITIVKEETIRNVVTPPIKGKKRKYSEISSELNQSANVPSPTEPKQKKRGRPPKIITSKIEETEVTKSVDKTIVTENDVITESAESVEENKVIDKINKQDNAKKQDTALILDTPKKDNTLKKHNTTKKENALKKNDNLIKEDTVIKDGTPKKEDALKKDDTPKKKESPEKDNSLKKCTSTKNENVPKKEDTPKTEDTPKKKDSLKKEDTPEKVGVSKSIDESSEEILDTKKAEVNKSIEAANEKKETNITADEEIKIHTEVHNATEELENTKAVEECEESKGIEETETINDVDESDTVERNEVFEEFETENVESNEDSEAEDLEAEDNEGEDNEGEYLEPEELEGEDHEAEDLDTCDENQEYEETDVDEETASDDSSYDGEECREVMRKMIEVHMKIAKAREEAEMAASVEGTDVTFTVPAPVIPKINVPDVIRHRIAFDFQMVVHNKRFVKFSKQFTVDRLVQDFNNSDPEAIFSNSSIGLTIIQYFNALIHSRLLYPSEKENRMNKKAAECLKTYIDDGEEFTVNDFSYPRKFWHLVYGPSYLIRLFVLLPEIVANYSYFESDTVYLVKRFETFMKFIANNFDQYFSEKFNDYCN